MMNTSDLNKRKSAVALGTFDGIHIGHRAVLDSVREKAKDGLNPIVLLFDCHPLEFLTGNAPKKIISDKKRDEIIASFGISEYITEFGKIVNMTPEQFVDEILVTTLHASTVSCGYNYTFAKDGKGDVETLRRLLRDRQIELNVLDEVTLDGEEVSSTKIRTLIENGQIEIANRMLGRHYSYSSRVVHGFERGRTLGFPTINQFFDPGLVVPKNGVYASLTTIDSVRYESFTDIGTCPTFSGSERKSETHIFDCKGNMYGSYPEVELVGYIRDEVKMSSADELKRQLESDELTAKRIIDEDKRKWEK